VGTQTVTILAAMAWGAVVGLAIGMTGWVPLLVLAPVGGFLIGRHLPEMLEGAS
jgi:hypothetical protein